jgi:hypothetical protein
MPTEHVVDQGECLSSIAVKYGVPPDKIWKDPANAKLKEKRKDPGVLYPGDVLSIPEKKTGEESGATNQKHRFKRKGDKTKARLRFMRDGKGLSNESYVLDVEGKTIEGKTNGDGWVEAPIPPGATKGTLYLGKKRIPFPLAFGKLDPVEETSGAQTRLKHLGYYSGEVDGRLDDKTVRAIKRFQKAKGLNESGSLDQKTQSKLKELHGG